jgi:hypothetical protein
MSLASIVGTIGTVISVAQAAIQAGKDAAPFLAALKNYFSKDEPTQEDLDALAAETDRLSAELQLPLPEGD